MVFVKILIKAILFSVLNLRDYTKFKEKGFKMFINNKFLLNLYFLTFFDLMFTNF